MRPVKIFTLIFFSILSFFIGKNYLFPLGSGAPPYAIEDLNPPEDDPYEWLNNWVRPVGPAKVGLQVGHWKNDELPEELARLRGNTGATGGGKNEWEVNLAIAEKTKVILGKQNIEVDILPSTIPPKYWADVFVAIHADGSIDKSVSGFKIASPRRDYSGDAEELLSSISKSYGEHTLLPMDANVSRNMTGYYAFAWWRYDHAVHPKTPSTILETGFLTNAGDRKIIVNNPEMSAEGLAEGIINYLKTKSLI
jgi:hypothetical protein